MSENNQDSIKKNEKINSSIERVEIEDEMKKSYLDYAMSVIVSRALPEIRDGLKLYIEEYFIQCMMVIMIGINLTGNLLGLLGRLWVNFTLMETVLYTNLWSEWHKAFL